MINELLTPKTGDVVDSSFGRRVVVNGLAYDTNGNVQSDASVSYASGLYTLVSNVFDPKRTPEKIKAKPKHGDVVISPCGKRVILEINGELGAWDEDGEQVSHCVQEHYDAGKYIVVDNIFGARD